MAPFVTILTYLLILSTLLVSETKLFYAREKSAYCRSLFCKREEERSFEKSRTLIQAFVPSTTVKEKRPSEPKEESVRIAEPLELHRKRPPNNSRLNFHLLFLQGKQGPLYEPAARLLRLLYKGQPFFDAIPTCEYALLDALIAQKDQTALFRYPDELASLTLTTPALTSAWHTMLSTSLLNHITFDRAVHKEMARINLLFASEPLLTALLAPTSLYAEKEAYLQRLFLLNADPTGRPTRSEVTAHLKTLFTSHCPPDLHPFFDFTTGHSGNILFTTDPTTGWVERSKL